jgi:hypothetical protein
MAVIVFANVNVPSMKPDSGHTPFSGLSTSIGGFALWVFVVVLTICFFFGLFKAATSQLGGGNDGPGTGFKISGICLLVLVIIGAGTGFLQSLVNFIHI